MRSRRNEQVGGGYFVFSRGSRTHRIKTGHIMAGRVPFEHPSLVSAITEAGRLARIHKRKFYVFKEVAEVEDEA